MNEMVLSILIMALGARESGNNPSAVNGKAAGKYQLTEVFVLDVNENILKRNQFSLNDRLDPVKSVQMIRIWFRHYEKPEWMPEDYIMSFRLGVRGWQEYRFSGVALPADLAQYLEDVLNLMEKYEAERFQSASVES